VTRRRKAQIIGTAYSISVATSVILSVIGVHLASAAHAPAWTFFLFFGLIAIAIPIGGVVGYLFYLPEQPDAMTDGELR
jgi:hypothetical protein